MKNITIFLAGNPGSGKSTVSAHLENQYGFKTVRPSNVIREYASSIGMILSERADFLQAHRLMNAEYGEHHIADTILSNPHNRVIADGLRVPHQVERLRQASAFGIALHCPDTIRFERAVLRGDAKDKKTFSEFIADETPEYRSAVPPYAGTLTVMEMCDYHVATQYSQEQVLATIDAIVQPHLLASSH